MPKKQNKTVWVCENCGGEHMSWAGKCNNCGSWNSLKEIKIGEEEAKAANIEQAKPIRLQQVKESFRQRISTKIEEFDLVLGGGIVRGSVILLGGHPGIGKSTLVWQVAASMKGTVVYIAGEESPEQMKLRASRISKGFENIIIFENQDINSWISQVEKIKPDLLIVDSIQTVVDSSLAASAGSIIQIKQCALRLINLAKTHSIATFFVGHVTKDGEVAGPKTLEHLVDAVFYLDGERNSTERFLRSQKNRFGPTDEMGVFNLTEAGLVSAENFGRIAKKEVLPVGVAQTGVLEGSRVLFLEVQSLVQKSNFGFPKRNAVGYDLNRLQMILAVLTRHTKVDLSSFDVYLNIGEGYRLNDQVGDLAVAMAIASSYYNSPLSGQDIFLSELDLSGQMHLNEDSKKIIKSSKKLGFKPVYSTGQVREVVDKYFLFKKS